MSLIQRLEKIKQTQASKPATGAKAKAAASPEDELREKVRSKLIAEVDATLLAQEDEIKRSLLRAKIEENIAGIGSEMQIALTKKQHEQIIQELIDDILGLGPIQKLVEDEDVSEIMVNGANQIYIEKKGKLTLTDVKFNDDEHVRNVINKIISPLGRRCDESQPYVDARLKDGSRVNAIIPPLALNGSTITIRKFKKDPLRAPDLIRFGAFPQWICDFMEACVKIHLNIVVSGGTGSGKTTLLNCLTSFISSGERILTCEDAAEIQILQPHWVRLETKAPNVEGKGAVTMRDLIKNSLRMRPDRVIVGECRSGETLDMLQAMNTGHDGSLTTLHANAPKEALSRIETMVMMAGMDLPARAIREQVSGAVHLIIQQSRLSDGSRRITYVTQSMGMEGEHVKLQDIFKYVQTGIDEKGKIVGEHRPQHFVPTFYPKFLANNIKIPLTFFGLSEEEAAAYMAEYEAKRRAEQAAGMASKAAKPALAAVPAAAEPPAPPAAVEPPAAPPAEAPAAPEAAAEAASGAASEARAAEAAAPAEALEPPVVEQPAPVAAPAAVAAPFPPPAAPVAVPPPAPAFAPTPPPAAPAFRAPTGPTFAVPRLSPTVAPAAEPASAPPPGAPARGDGETA